MKNLPTAYAAFAIKNRKIILFLVAIATLFTGYFVKDLDIRNDPDTLLPESNRYVATNAYGEQKFGFGNIMVVGFVVKECTGGNDPYKASDKILNHDKKTGKRIHESAAAKMTRRICEKNGGTWDTSTDVYQPWFVNMVKKAHTDMINLDHSRGNNFMDIAADKVKYMGTSEDGGLKFERLVPVSGIELKDKSVYEKQLAHLKKGLETNPILAPMLLLKKQKNGKRCEFGDDNWYDDTECKAKGLFIIGDYADTVKEDYLPWIKETRLLVDEINNKYGDRVEIRISGEPYLMSYMMYDLIDKWWLFAISFLIVILMLWHLNRGWRGSLFPLLGVVSTIVITLGVMGLSGYKLTTMMVLTPMLLLAIGTGHAVQVIRRYQYELYSSTGLTPMQAAEKAIAKTITPASLAILTDMAGFFMLSFVDISFYKAYAYFGMFGMFTILITTTTLAPIMMAMYPERKRKGKGAKKMVESSGFEKSLANVLSCVVVTRKRWIPILITLGVIGYSAHLTKVFEPTEESHMPGLEVGINYARAAFKYDSHANVDLRRLGEIMPGVISVNIPIKGKKDFFPMLEECSYDGTQNESEACWDPDEDNAQGAFNNADVMAAIEKTEDWMRAHPNIGFTGSYIQFIKMVNMLMMTPEGQEPDLKYFHIPNKEFISNNMDVYGDEEDPEWIPNGDEIVTGFNGLLEANTSAGDLDSFVAKDYNEGLIMGFVNTMDPVKTHQTVKDIQKFFKDNENEPGFNLVTWGFKSGDIVHMPETGKVVNIEDTGTTTMSVGGFLGATEATHDVAEVEYLRSPLMTAAAIFVISAIIFLSPLVAGILTSALALTLFSQYGLGAYYTSVENWSGNLHFATLVSLSIAMGLGVDYSIYMISRLREEMILTGRNWLESLRRTLETTGAAVFASIIVMLASFIPLVMTELANTWALAVFISEALIMDVLIALTIIPLMVYAFKPKYVFGSKKELAQEEKERKNQQLQEEKTKQEIL